MIRTEGRRCQRTMFTLLSFSGEACPQSVNPKHNKLKLIGRFQRLVSQAHPVSAKNPSLPPAELRCRATGPAFTDVPTYTVICLGQLLKPLWSQAPPAERPVASANTFLRPPLTPGQPANKTQPIRLYSSLGEALLLLLSVISV